MGTENFGLVIHGGAGTMARDKMTIEVECAHRDGLQRALDAGYKILRNGGTALDATEAAVRVLEDDPHFNAGKGAVFTSAGTNELDASIMDGKTIKGRSGCKRAAYQEIRSSGPNGRWKNRRTSCSWAKARKRFAKENGRQNCRRRNISIPRNAGRRCSA